MISLRSRLSRTSPKMKRARCFFGTKSCTLAGRSCISSIFQGAKLLAHRAERNKTHAEIASRPPACPSSQLSAADSLWQTESLFAEYRGALHRSRQADLQAAGRPDREVHAGGRLITSIPILKIESPAVMAGLFCFGPAKDYRATRSLLSAVPIALNVVTIWLELVS